MGLDSLIIAWIILHLYAQEYLHYSAQFTTCSFAHEFVLDIVLMLVNFEYSH